jgi:hypothetical protein
MNMGLYMEKEVLSGYYLKYPEQYLGPEASSF